jgi:hypothetical protein
MNYFLSILPLLHFQERTLRRGFFFTFSEIFFGQVLYSGRFVLVFISLGFRALLCARPFFDEVWRDRTVRVSTKDLPVCFGNEGFTSFVASRHFFFVTIQNAGTGDRRAAPAKERTQTDRETLDSFFFLSGTV